MKPTRELCIMACVFCRDAQFLAWLNHLAVLGGEPEGLAPATEADAKEFITTLCGVTSRNDLDRDPAAAQRFHELVRLPFLEWKGGDDAHA